MVFIFLLLPSLRIHAPFNADRVAISRQWRRTVAVHFVVGGHEVRSVVLGQETRDRREFLTREGTAAGGCPLLVWQLGRETSDIL